MLNGGCVEPTDEANIQIVVLDAGPAIHLDEIDCLHILADFKRIIVPKAVSLEIEYRRPVVFHKNIRFDKADVVIAETIHTTCKLFSLDTGEIEAIALCSNNPAAVLLTDDASARLAAKTLGIRAYGTISLRGRFFIFDKFNTQNDYQFQLFLTKISPQKKS